VSEHKQLGFWATFCIAAGAMISSGLFVLPGLAFSMAGPGVILAYGLAGLLVLPALFCQAELVSAMPKAGGSYFHIERSLGTLAGTFAGLAGWFAISLKAAFALVGMGAFLELISPGANLFGLGWEWTIKLTAVALSVLFTAVNCLTVKGAGRLQIFLVVPLLGVLVTFVGWGLGGEAVRHTRFAGFADAGLWTILATSGLVFISFGGLTATANVAGEVRNGARTLPRAMIAALAVVAVLYVAAMFVTVGVTDADVLDGSLTPLSDAARTFAGAPGAIVLAAAAILAYITTANGGILEASRAPAAMAADSLLPSWLAARSHRGVPVIGVLATGAFMVAVLLALSIEDLVKVASTVLLLLYVMICLAVLIMRTSRIQNYRPVFRSPAQPWMSLAGIVIYFTLIADMGVVPLTTTAAFFIAGAVWYCLYVRPRTRRESALVHWVKNIVAPDIRRSGLEDELRQIAVERDEIVHDRFDHLVKDCPIIDMYGPATLEEMFAEVAAVLVDRVGMSKADLLAAFKHREQAGSTMVRPGVAIPHVIVPGRHVFEIVLVRCRRGVIVAEDQPHIKTAFVLVGSDDERNYHLRALMAIAHIIESPNFIERWLEAMDVEHLRDLVLLVERQRDAT
jgi:amino acid transporter/mannitol/fructose-specific phosphotransferase system IIA component (Ntr-type)